MYLKHFKFAIITAHEEPCITFLNLRYKKKYVYESFYQTQNN